MVAIQEQLLAAVGDRRGVGAADRLCEACVVLFGVDAAAIWSSTGANAGTLGASHLRRPPGPLPLPSSPPVIGRDAPPASRNRMGRGGPLQFPPPLSERSEPLTPGSPSRLHLQDLHRFHGLRPSPPGSALPCPTRPRAGLLTTRQASLDVTDRSVAHPAQRGARRWASTPPVSRRHRQPATGPPDSYPDRTYTGKRRRAYESAINHLHDPPPTVWTHRKNRLAATAFRRDWTRTSSTLPCWSTARHRYRSLPLIPTNTSSRCHLSPGRGRRRRSWLA